MRTDAKNEQIRVHTGTCLGLRLLFPKLEPEPLPNLNGKLLRNPVRQPVPQHREGSYDLDFYFVN